jgi:hypothetical protein
MPEYAQAGKIINLAASECGLTAVADPFTSADPAFVQLVNILNTCGRELVGMFEWQKLNKSATYTTPAVPVQDIDNILTLPADYGYMIEQTGWTPTQGGLGLPLGGPLNSQDWSYLVNTNLASSTIYVSFRIAEGEMQLLPNPPPADTIINFMYIMRNWVLRASDSVEVSEAGAFADIVYYDIMLAVKFLKLRFLEAKGFDTNAAVQQFSNVYQQWTGRDVPNMILNMARYRIFPYLDIRNVPQTGYGLP